MKRNKLFVIPFIVMHIIAFGILAYFFGVPLYYGIPSGIIAGFVAIFIDSMWCAE